MKTTTLPFKHSMNLPPVRLALLLIPLALTCFALTPQARAVCQEGCDTTNFNTFLGNDALVNNTTGFGNTATGSTALGSNTTGDTNTATGYAALFSNTTGFLNTATGAGALDLNTTGSNNTATGSSALASNTIGTDNTATGGGALYNNTTGSFNTAIGDAALTFNTTGYSNTAAGADALDQNTTGYLNTVCGFHALLNNTTGNSNIALGASAGVNLITGDNNIDIGNAGLAGESSKIRIGTQGTHIATYIAGIGGTPLVHGAALAVGITPDGQLGVRPSSARFKEAIKPMGSASEAILSLKPVTFRYKHDLDPDDVPQFGLLAEEVEKVNRDLIARDDQGKPYIVRYEAVNAMLLNEFLKEHKTVQEQGTVIARQQKQIDALTAGLQKVSAQLEVSKPAPQTVLNNH